MNFQRLLSTALATLAGVGVLLAGDKKDPGKKEDEVEKALSRIAQLGPGVQKIKKDDQDQIIRLMVVGQAQINTSLGKAIGLETARKKAQLNARAELIRFFKEKVEVYEKTEDEVIFFEEGSADAEKGQRHKSGKRVEKTTEKVESVAAGVLRGTQVLFIEISDKDKTYTVVLGWDAKSSDAIRKVTEDLGGFEGEAGKGKKGNASKKEADKIEDRKATSSDAKKFVD